MSLIITSNQGTENTPQTSNAFKPFSYQNRLLNTMRIPPNSEIALQSAKINKNGLFILDRTNSGFCTYFGTVVDGLHNNNIANSTTVPFRAVIGSGDAFRAGDEKNEVNITDMVGEIQKGINQAIFHPSLINGTDSTSVVVSDIHDSSNQSFKGFSFVATQATALTKRAKADIVWTSLNKNNDDVRYPFTQAGGVITPTSANGCYVQNREFPLSQNGGEAIFNFSDAQGGGGNWMVGLSRINLPRDNGDGNFDYTPTYFDAPANNALSGVQARGQFRYADICVMRQNNELRVYQSGSRTAQAQGTGIFVNEVTYFGGHNAKFATKYNIQTNGSGYEQVKFVLNNEELEIYMVNPTGAGTEDLLCDFSKLQAAGATKNQCLNPTNATKWAMYPVIGISGATAGNSRTISLESIQHYANYPKYDAARYYNYDWWGWSQHYNQTTFCRELELRDWNNFSRTTTNHGIGANGLLPPSDVNASGGMEEYDFVIITARSDAYGRTNTELCNTQSTLGFLGDPVSRPVNVSLLSSSAESSSVPKLIANISLFIRLNNFTQNSMNARQGTLSKIVAHLPRFDNSGNETGGLYFEPHEKTYISLNNPTELFINSFDVDIVYENETLCTALTGKTIVCFHVREKR
tara:strand:+ start:2101 stop:4005 length:1905 start_codon:yes stop_codon:yes gene_type:complete